MINLTPINKKIQKRLFEKMDVLGRKTFTAPNQPAKGGGSLTHAKMATRSTFLRMTSGQLNPVILMGGKLKDDGSMSGGYDDIYGSRTYFADDQKMQEDAAHLYNLKDGYVSQAMENIITTGQSLKVLENNLKRPMPGVKGVDVQFKGGVRALREATITWTCWDFDELDLLMPHFLAHGKTVMIEWGWVYDKDTLQKLPSFLKTDPDTNVKYISVDVYSNYREEIFKADGDFDMMVGIIKNFEFTTREDGAFDCTTILTSVGASILGNPQANEVALDPNITYNLSINEDDRETAEKLTKAVGETGQEYDTSQIMLEGIAEGPGAIKDIFSVMVQKPNYKVNGRKATAEQIDVMLDGMSYKQLTAPNFKISIDNDFDGRADKLQNIILNGRTKEAVSAANPELNNTTLDAIVKLEREVATQEGKALGTVTGKKKISDLKSKIVELQENQLEEEVVEEVVKTEQEILEQYNQLSPEEKISYLERAGEELASEAEGEGLMPKDYNISEEQTNIRAAALLDEDLNTKPRFRLDGLDSQDQKTSSITEEMNKKDKNEIEFEASGASRDYEVNPIKEKISRPIRKIVKILRVLDNLRFVLIGSFRNNTRKDVSNKVRKIQKYIPLVYQTKLAV